MGKASWIYALRTQSGSSSLSSTRCASYASVSSLAAVASQRLHNDREHHQYRPRLPVRKLFCKYHRPRFDCALILQDLSAHQRFLSRGGSDSKTIVYPKEISYCSSHTSNLKCPINAQPKHTYLINKPVNIIPSRGYQMKPQITSHHHHDNRRVA